MSLLPVHESAKLLEKSSINSPEAILNRAFSTTLALSTTPTFAMEQQKASTDDKLQLYSQLGFGRCGFVFELTGTGQVAKVAISEDGMELYGDLCMHQKIRESLQEVPQEISLCHIPTPRHYIAANDLQWWEKTASVYTYIHVYVKEGGRDVGADYFRTRSDIRTNMSCWRNSPFLLRLFHGADGSTSVMS